MFGKTKSLIASIGESIPMRPQAMRRRWRGITSFLPCQLMSDCFKFIKIAQLLEFFMEVSKVFHHIFLDIDNAKSFKPSM